MSQLVWLITGCSSGLGSQLALALLARNERVIATARDVSKLSHLSAKGASILQLDVTDTNENIASVIDRARSINGRIDVLVNNAGYVQIGLVEDLAIHAYERQMSTNLFGAIKVTQAVLPHMRARKQGTIVFISSLSGLVAHPAVSAYASSKFALEGFAESLKGEVAALGIKVHLLEPGRFRTKLLSPGSVQMQGSSVPDYAEFSKMVLESIAAESGKQPGDPEKLVRVLIDVVKGGEVCRGRDMPFRLMLGRDCFEEVQTKLQDMQTGMEEWKNATMSTDFGAEDTSTDMSDPLAMQHLLNRI